MGLFDAQPDIEALSTMERLFSPADNLRRQAAARRLASSAVAQSVRPPFEVVSFMPYVRLPNEFGIVTAAMN